MPTSRQHKDNAMNQQIIEEIRNFAANAPANRFPDSDEPYFDEPLAGFASSDDPLFSRYKTVIGEFHLTPQELVAGSLGAEAWRPVSVISWILPITAATRRSNRTETLHPSREWAMTRNFGEGFNAALRRHLVGYLTSLGHNAIAPQLAPVWREYSDTPAGIASSWSERHAAYAAGLGTFSLNDALITPRGIAHRCGSVITDLELEPSVRPYGGHLSNCLHFREGTCGLCISRCPAGALSRDGHDKSRCRSYVYETLTREVAGKYGVTVAGCGLCQTKVPCEGCIPKGSSRPAR